jgi:hypothetical protein
MLLLATNNLQSRKKTDYPWDNHHLGLRVVSLWYLVFTFPKVINQGRRDQFAQGVGTNPLASCSNTFLNQFSQRTGAPSTRFYQPITPIVGGLHYVYIVLPQYCPRVTLQWSNMAKHIPMVDFPLPCLIIVGYNLVSKYNETSGNCGITLYRMVPQLCECWFTNPINYRLCIMKLEFFAPT